MNKITIIIPSYNHEAFLKDRLRSIENQTYKDWEVVIIDDCSTDNSLDILNDFINKNTQRVKHFIINKTNLGSGYLSWQKGISLAETEYIWIAETDDYSVPTFLEESIKILEENKKTPLVFCSSIYVDEQKKYLYDSINRTKDLKLKENQVAIFDSAKLIEKMPFNSYIINGSSVLFRKPKVKIPDEIFTNKQTSDIFLWTFLVEKQSFAFLNKRLNFFRRHKNSTTSKMSTFHQKKVYIENAKYLNLFNQTDKHQMFIDHYLKYYVWNIKKDIFNTEIFEEIKNVSQIKKKYYKTLFKLIIQKAFKKLWK